MTERIQRLHKTYICVISFDIQLTNQHIQVLCECVCFIRLHDAVFKNGIDNELCIGTHTYLLSYYMCSVSQFFQFLW